MATWKCPHTDTQLKTPEICYEKLSCNAAFVPHDGGNVAISYSTGSNIQMMKNVFFSVAAVEKSVVFKMKNEDECHELYKKSV